MIGNLVNKKVTNPYCETNFNHTFEGSKLKQVSIPEAGVGFTYKYNDEGVRIFKNNYGTYYYYTVLGNKVLKETWGNNTIIYTYDVDGSLISFNYNGVEYFYVKSSLNDIMKIVNSSGSILVTYDYDAYGNIINVTDNSGINLSYINPYRYRSYRYDNETGYYYLNQRYYDPSIGRFISRDDIGYIDPSDSRGLNLYAYCMNNPIMYVDPDGEFAVTTFLISIAIGAVFGGFLGGFTAINNGAEIGSQEFWIGLVTGAILGAAVGAVAGWSIAGGSAALLNGGLSSIANKFISDIFYSASVGKIKISGWEEYAVAFVIGGVTNGIGSKYKKTKFALDVIGTPLLTQLSKTMIRNDKFDFKNLTEDIFVRAITKKIVPGEYQIMGLEFNPNMGAVRGMIKGVRALYEQ
ncbi:MAG: RHS repeat-associated core domain-containing protein [Acholeplasmatales bacterium]